MLLLESDPICLPLTVPSWDDTDLEFREQSTQTTFQHPKLGNIVVFVRDVVVDHPSRHTFYCVRSPTPQYVCVVGRWYAREGVTWHQVLSLLITLGLWIPGKVLSHIEWPLRCSYHFFRRYNFENTASATLDYRAVPASAFEFLQTHTYASVPRFLSFPLLSRQGEAFVPALMRNAKVATAEYVAGGILSGRPQRKTINTFKYFTFYSHGHGSVLFLIPPRDLRTARLFLRPEMVVTQRAALRRLCGQPQSPKLWAISHALLRFREVRQTLAQENISVLVVDHFLQLRALAWFDAWITDLKYNTLWLLSSCSEDNLATKDRAPGLNADLVRWYRLAPAWRLRQGFSESQVNALVQGLLLTCHYGGNPRQHLHTLRIRFGTPLDTDLFARMYKAVCASAENPSSDPGPVLQTVGALFSGARRTQYEVQKLLLERSGGVFPGGKPYVPLRPWSELACEEHKDDVKCHICQEHDVGFPVRNTGCQHTFCYTCLLEWSVLQSTCPLCRKTFEPGFLRLDRHARNGATTRKRALRRPPAPQNVYSNAWLETAVKNLSFFITGSSHVLVLVSDDEHVRACTASLRSVLPEKCKIVTYLSTEKNLVTEHSSELPLYTVSHTQHADALRNVLFTVVVLGESNGDPRILYLVKNYYGNSAKIAFDQENSLLSMLLDHLAEWEYHTSPRSVLKMYANYLQSPPPPRPLT